MKLNFSLTKLLLSSTTLFFTVCNEGCTKDVGVKKAPLDPISTSSESVSSANEMSATSPKFLTASTLRPVPQLKPNLKVTSLYAGTCAPLSYKVSNGGGSSSGSFNVIVYQSGIIVQNNLIYNLNAGESLTFSYNGYNGYIMPITGYFKITADPSNAVDELSETDNTVSVTTECVH
jgi:subtilase family serine protease